MPSPVQFSSESIADIPWRLMAVGVLVATFTACGGRTTGPEPLQSPAPDKHRVSHEHCDDVRPAVNGGDPAQTGPAPGECVLDADCTAGIQGRCMNNRGVTFCTYDECTTDGDCSGGPCKCGLYSESNTCVAGNCQIDADCGIEGYCSPTLGGCGNYSGIVGYWCHTPQDDCVVDADCTTPPNGIVAPGYCMYSNEASHWICGYTHCVGLRAPSP